MSVRQITSATYNVCDKHMIQLYGMLFCFLLKPGTRISSTTPIKSTIFSSKVSYMYKILSTNDAIYIDSLILSCKRKHLTIEYHIKTITRFLKLKHCLNEAPNILLNEKVNWLQEEEVHFASLIKKIHDYLTFSIQITLIFLLPFLT